MKNIKKFESFKLNNVSFNYGFMTMIKILLVDNCWEEDNGYYTQDYDNYLSSYAKLIFDRKENDEYIYKIENDIRNNEYNFTYKNLMSLYEEGDIEIIYNIDNDVKDLCEQLLIDLIEKDYILNLDYYSRYKSGKELIITIYKPGTVVTNSGARMDNMSHLDFKDCKDVILKFINIFTDSYKIVKVDYTYKTLQYKDILEIDDSDDFRYIQFSTMI